MNTAPISPLPTNHRWLIIGGGAVGVLVLLAGIGIAMAGYTAGGGFSPLNRFISELGHTTHSARAGWFNAAVILSSAACGVHLIGVSIGFTGWVRRVLIVGALAAAGFGALVGVFPTNVDRLLHRGAALGFFEGSLALLIAFSLAVRRGRQPPYPRWSAWLSLPMAIANVIFLGFITIGGVDLLGTRVSDRPPVWAPAIAEWAVLIGLIVWVTTMTVYTLMTPPARVPPS